MNSRQRRIDGRAHTRVENLSAGVEVSRNSKPVGVILSVSGSKALVKRNTKKGEKQSYSVRELQRAA